MTPEWLDAHIFSPAEIHGAEVVARSDTRGDELVQPAAALALWAPRHGHACVDLAAVERTVADTVANERADRLAPAEPLEPVKPPLVWPTTAQWLDSLTRSPICRAVNDCADEPRLDAQPLVLHGTLLYTQRQWFDECTVANDLRRRADLPARATRAETEQLLDELLPPEPDHLGRPSPTRQHDAARAAVSARLSVIVGGPGTGKTHTIARLLAALDEQAALDGAPLRIVLAAPTGKAAARMADALAKAAPTGRIAELRPTTIHGLLGVRWRRTRFQHGPDNRLDADVVVIDEASMVALPLMARLVEALRPDARLILVGDPDQLESIEVGSVLTDIVAAAAVPGSPLARSVTRLDRLRRHAADSSIGPLAEAIRSNDPDEVVRLLRHGGAPAGNGDIAFVDTARTTSASAEAAIRAVAFEPLQAATAAARAGDAVDALARFAQIRVLCAHRTGPFGVQHWNRVIDSWLVDSSARPTSLHPGLPLLVTRNDERLRISNGDTGIVIADDDGPRVAFATQQGVRLLSPAQLDAVETAYAMTIHKSQGSEYRAVVVVLPPPGSPLIGRELLYTAATRSTGQLLIVGDEAALRACVGSPGRRITGLAGALARPVD